MRAFGSIFLLVLIGFMTFAVSGKESASEEFATTRIAQALVTLNKVPSGAKLLQSALHVWNYDNLADLMNNFRGGDVSRTDTTLTRHFNPKTVQEDRDREVIIFLKLSQSDFEIALDMAHELVHATARPNFDPYDPSLTPGQYIWNAIEGEGGEVDAVFMECTIGMEMANLQKLSLKRCQSYLSDEYSMQTVSKQTVPKMNREKIRREFYRVGKWFSKLTAKLASEVQLFPVLSSDTLSLYSSTGRSPYPVALLNEYIEITDTACENSQKRLHSLTYNASIHTVSAATNSVQHHVQEFLKKRCN